MKHSQRCTVTFMLVKAVCLSCSSDIPLGVCKGNEREELKRSGITTLFFALLLLSCLHNLHEGHAGIPNATASVSTCLLKFEFCMCESVFTYPCRKENVSCNKWDL